MSSQSNIAWCDSTVNFWEGCTKVSPGCANCYAEARDRRMMIESVIHWGKGAPRRKSKSAVKAALSMNRKPWICDDCGNTSLQMTCAVFNGFAYCSQCVKTTHWHRRRIFSLSLGDWLDGEVPIEWLAEMLDTIRKCDRVTWILCSKRWELFFERTHAVIKFIEESAAWRCGICSPQEGLRNWLADWQMLRKPPANIVGLCSGEDQRRADERIPKFLTVPLACRGLSLEPLLGPVDLRCVGAAEVAGGKLGVDYLDQQHQHVDWIIAGGESGPNARPCDVNWIRSLAAQGKASGVATFVKQLGAASCDEGHGIIYPLQDKKGGSPSEWPADLRVQEWPKGF